MKNNIRTRLAALFCAAALLLGVGSPAFAAETTPTVSVSSTSVQPGGSCTLTVSGQNFPGISALTFFVTYDTNAFELTSAAGRSVMDYETVNTKNEGFVQFSGVSDAGISGTNDLLRLVFRAKDDADPRAYSISLMVTDAADTDCHAVTVATSPGTITVKEPAEETTPTVTFSSRLSSSTVKAGDPVSLTLYSYSLYNLAAAQIDFTYDEDVLAYESLELLPTMQREGAISTVKADTKGHVIVAYASPEAVSTGNLMKVTFTARTDAPVGVTKIGITPLSLADDEQKALAYNTPSASVTVEREEEEPVLPRIWLDVPETLRTDASFTVNLYAEGASGLAAGDFTVAYDPEALVCKNVTSSQSSGEDESLNNTTVIIDDRYQSGTVKFSVMCHGGITEDTALVSMQFHAKNNAETTTRLTPAVSSPINDALEPLTFDVESASFTIVVPKFTVVFKNWDGTVLKTDDVPYLGAAEAPSTPTRAYDAQYHYDFSAWDTDFSSVKENLVVTAQYTQSAHTLGQWRKQDDALHVRGCTGCAYTETEAHHFETYVPDGNAACETDGTKTAVCTSCEATDTQADVGTALGHSFTNYISNGDATCAADGTKTARCDRCDVTDTKPDADSALGHIFTKYVSNGDATCTADGTKTAKCDRCDATDTQTDVGTTLGHSFTKYVSNGDATCTADGTETAKCDRCDATDTQTDVGTALGHSFTSYSSNGDATCTEDGTETAKCDRCDATDTQPDTGSALGHIFTNYTSNGDATCTADGTETAVCDRENCNVTDTRTAVGSMLPHAFTGWSYHTMDTHQGVCTCGETSEEPHTWEIGICTVCHAAQVELEHTTDADKETYALRVNYGLVEENCMTVDVAALTQDVATGRFAFELTFHDAVAAAMSSKRLQVDLGFLSVSLDAETASGLTGSVLVIEAKRYENGCCAVSVKMRAANGEETSLSGSAAIALKVPPECTAYLAWCSTNSDSFRLLDSTYEEEQSILRVTHDPQAEQIFVNCISVAETDGTVTVDASGPESSDIQMIISSYQEGQMLQCDSGSLGSTFSTARRGDQLKLFVLDASFVPLLPSRTI